MNDHDTECYSKKNQNEIYKMIIIAQFTYEGTSQTHSAQLLSHYSAFLKESSCIELESMQSPEEIAQSTDISSLNVCKFNDIFDRLTR